MAQGFNWLLLFSQLQGWWDEWWQTLVGAFTALALLLGLAGCGPGPNMTDEQRAADIETKIMYLDRVVDIAEKHAVSWHAELDLGGRPSIGECAELFLDTDARMRISLQGNAAAARTPAGGG